jgi:hypothetical protein
VEHCIHVWLTLLALQCSDAVLGPCDTAVAVGWQRTGGAQLCVLDQASSRLPLHRKSEPDHARTQSTPSTNSAHRAPICPSVATTALPSKRPVVRAAPDCCGPSFSLVSSANVTLFSSPALGAPLSLGLLATTDLRVDSADCASDGSSSGAGSDSEPAGRWLC